MPTITKERRCKECGCNTLRQTQERETESVINWRNVMWYCLDCDELIETELVEINWRHKESNSTKLARLERQLARARQQIKQMSDAADAKLRASLSND
jgi:hypothetical protein